MIESKMTNSEILAYKGTQLSGLDKQRRFVLLQLTRPMGCPNCATPQTYVEAAGLTVDTVDLNKAADDPCKCGECSRELKYTVPMMGDCHWTLVPVKPTKKPIIRRELAAVLADLPPMCFARHPGDGSLVAIKRGEAGYHAAGDSGDTGRRIREKLVTRIEDADDAGALNASLGVTPAQSLAMLNGSMFGFDVPGADPMNCAQRTDPTFVAADRGRR